MGTNKNVDPLSCNELEIAKTKLLTYIQQESFPQDISHIKQKGVAHPKSSILSLNPFLDKDGLLRVSGRIGNSTQDYNKKHQILLPPKHHFTKILISHEHKRLHHLPSEQLLYSLRERYWLINGRNQTKQCVRTCTQCYRLKPKVNYPFMSDLPRERVLQQSPFFITGVDYAGPITIRDRLGRGWKPHKAYIALFICFTTKAIHLDLVTDPSTDAFIMCLRRFIGRRGKPSQLYSDNGTNFVGANRQLKELYSFIKGCQNELVDKATVEGISWKFIPPRAPHFGGLWEAGVKSAKTHLYCILGNATLTFEYLYTTLVQIESILNSRPLSPHSSDPNDLLPLTPSHFLIGKTITTLPSHDLQLHPVNRLDKYQHVQQLMQHFWKRWSTEFITELQQRKKWKTKSPNLQPNQLVLVKEDNLPPLNWLLGRILKLHPSKDNVVRVATITTSKGIYTRPVTRLCPFPIEDSPSV